MGSIREFFDWDANDYLLLGLLGTLLGGVLALVFRDSALVLMGAGIAGFFSLFLQVGLIGKGVEAGYKAYERGSEKRS